VANKWLDEQTATMRGLFGNLLYEAQRIEADVFDQLSSCDTCQHLFDTRDPRCCIEEEFAFCPACELEAAARAAQK
jgi:hypothetical protein